MNENLLCEADLTDKFLLDFGLISIEEYDIKLESLKRKDKIVSTNIKSLLEIQIIDSDKSESSKPNSNYNE